MTAGRRRRLEIAAAGGAALMVAGTFSPWLRSGRSRRNLYQAAGVLHRLMGLDGPAGAALDALPWLALYCAGCGLAFALGQHRIASVALLAAGVAVGWLSVAVLRTSGSPGVRPVFVGPFVTGSGAVTVTLSILLLARRGRRGSARRPDPDPDGRRPDQHRPPE